VNAERFLVVDEPAPSSHVSPVVLVHGFLGEPQDWDAVVACLDVPRATYRVDLLEADVARCDLSTFAGTLADALVRARLAPATIVGYSLGARVAMTLLTEHPNAVSRVVAVSGSPGVFDETERRERASADDALAAALEENGLAPFLDRWYSAPLFASLRSHPDYAMVARRRLAGDGRAWAKVLRDASPGRNPSLWDRLPGLASRLWLAVGSLDGKYLSFARAAHRVAPSMPLTIIDGAGHAVHLERPDALASLIDRLP